MDNVIGIAGLGKMGKNIALNLLDKGYKVVAYNRSGEPREEVKAKGAQAVDTIAKLVYELEAPRTVWLMLPSGDVTEKAVEELSVLLEKGDIIVDGSNSRYKDGIRRHKILQEKGIGFLDAGCSGGPSGALNGMSIMVGGERKDFERLEKLFADLSVMDGYMYVGGPGSGHFVKMVHNAIEYGMMQSIAEGLDMLENGPYNELSLDGICGLWNNGSVVRGYLMELAARALSNDPKLKSVKPFVEDTGEGRWAAETAIEFGIPFTTLTHALYERFSSRYDYQFGRRALAALRHEFGGHEVKGKK